MSNPQTDQSNHKKLRLWPGLALLVVQLIAWFLVPLFFPKLAIFGVFAGIICAVLIALWWLFFSRAPWVERIAAILLMVLAVIVTKRIVHASIAGGMMGMMLPVFSIPVLSLALVASLALTRNFSATVRRIAIVAAILVACGLFTLLRTGGITGDAKSDLHWRWSKTPEERMLALSANEPVAPLPAAAIPATEVQTESGWPGFRGARRDGVVRGVRIDTNWAQKPPVAIWRKPIGPGWSSFAVQNDLIFTQEQRGENEVVSCYKLTTGQPVWRHQDPARFYESNAGPGPRGTPTLSNGRVYTFGATGILNVLDARNGNVVWSRNAATDTNTKTPHWGFASSPVVINDVVIVAASGVLAAYDIASGKLRWSGPDGGRGGYSSPHLLTINGVPQVLLVNSQGVSSLSPNDGALLWKYAWEGDSIVQPAITTDGDVLLGSGSGLGSQVGVVRLAVSEESGNWTSKERWKSTGLMPYFNDFVVHKGNAFGFDGDSLACIDLNTGESKWSGGNYGHGQMVLLSDQDLMLVLSEAGEVALVKAVADQYSEIGRFKAINGKTWNHPVLVGDTLLVRNGEEMAAFKLNLAN